MPETIGSKKFGKDSYTPPLINTCALLPYEKGKSFDTPHLSPYRMLNGFSRPPQPPRLNLLLALKTTHRRLYPLSAEWSRQKRAVDPAVRALSTSIPRLAKSTSTPKLRALAEKPLARPLPPLQDGDKATRWPTVVQEVYDNMQKFPDCVVLTKVGGFYELYFEQAEDLAPLLNLKVAAKRTIAGPVPMVATPSFLLVPGFNAPAGRLSFFPT